MSINSFYTDTLGANLANIRWSWGAEDTMTNRLYLRVWDDERRQLPEGEGIVVLLDAARRKSNGFKERQRHIEDIRQGKEAYGVLCVAVDPMTTDARIIKSFDKDMLLRLGDLVHVGDRTYALITDRVSTAQVARQQTAQSTLAEDIRAILRKKVEPTTKEALVNARVGQGKFRADVLKIWRNRCCVTGSLTNDAIRASHIKPWRDSTDEERLDPYNGLPLIANLDALFDAGLISFEDSGKMLVSSELAKSEREIFCVLEASLVKKPATETAQYLAFHRESRFKGS